MNRGYEWWNDDKDRRSDECSTMDWTGCWKWWMKWLGVKERKRMNKVWTGNDIGPEGAIMISEGLKCNSTLTRLNLKGDEKNDKVRKEEEKNNNEKNVIWTENGIGVEGAGMISETLKCNSTLTELNLSSDEWSGKEGKKTRIINDKCNMNR